MASPNLCLMIIKKCSKANTGLWCGPVSMGLVASKMIFDDFWRNNKADGRATSKYVKSCNVEYRSIVVLYGSSGGPKLRGRVLWCGPVSMGLVASKTFFDDFWRNDKADSRATSKYVKSRNVEYRSIVALYGPSSDQKLRGTVPGFAPVILGLLALKWFLT